ncbi:hypothetical protein [Brenneria izbisi]|uniref:Uncharacterized protein n=1 Tax=Brenneria izbisi TaxID=2939450 RepID=A0AA41XZ65_9GAMM|nr:hypothetical protein [Brenneria izbisi]MCV9879506.1 hypothetical protein [Brenneria izbisi]MCV9882895.1 hypothetical protein [Brenneria izbisi]
MNFHQNEVSVTYQPLRVSAEGKMLVLDALQDWPDGKFNDNANSAG